ncbi:MAG: hypothetical protein K2N81_03865 [Acetatifactor sp.]|nr:hypothetical protein [Acetatifactor sp.]
MKSTEQFSLRYCEDYIQMAARREETGRNQRALAEVGAFSYSALKE